MCSSSMSVRVCGSTFVKSKLSVQLGLKSHTGWLRFRKKLQGCAQPFWGCADWQEVRREFKMKQFSFYLWSLSKNTQDNWVIGLYFWLPSFPHMWPVMWRSRCDNEMWKQKAETMKKKCIAVNTLRKRNWEEGYMGNCVWGHIQRRQETAS